MKYEVWKKKIRRNYKKCIICQKRKAETHVFGIGICIRCFIKNFANYNKSREEALSLHGQSGW